MSFLGLDILGKNNQVLADSFTECFNQIIAPTTFHCPVGNFGTAHGGSAFCCNRDR